MGQATGAHLATSSSMREKNVLCFFMEENVDTSLQYSSLRSWRNRTCVPCRLHKSLHPFLTSAQWLLSIGVFLTKGTLRCKLRGGVCACVYVYIQKIITFALGKQIAFPNSWDVLQLWKRKPLAKALCQRVKDCLTCHLFQVSKASEAG